MDDNTPDDEGRQEAEALLAAGYAAAPLLQEAMIPVISGHRLDPTTGTVAMLVLAAGANDQAGGDEESFLTLAATVWRQHVAFSAQRERAASGSSLVDVAGKPLSNPGGKRG